MIACRGPPHICVHSGPCRPRPSRCTRRCSSCTSSSSSRSLARFDGARKACAASELLPEPKSQPPPPARGLAGALGSSSGLSCSLAPPSPPDAAAGRREGKSTLKRTSRSPWPRPPLLGMPRPLTTQTSPGRTIWPSGHSTSKLEPSTCFTEKCTPLRASSRGMLLSSSRSASPAREKIGCFFSRTSTMMSPVSMPGASSALPSKTKRWPLGQPGATCTGSFSVLCTTPEPPHFPHVHPGGTVAPAPPQAAQVRWNCV
mmetsp:Transcript_59392/g.173758  ORF Transcript_59392/g.173758 Transcript_59392/m.173758 type:complete len:258 (+) Transcript_59392:37-810(+)